MNHSFKLIVNPSDTTEIEITSLLQYCALKNTLSELTSNNIRPLKFNRNPVLFSNENISTRFTEYIRMSRSERNTFKTKALDECDDSIFFDALSECECAHPGFLRRREIYRREYKDTTQDYYTVDDLCTNFMSINASEYLLKYIPEDTCEVCYAEISKTNDNKDINICYEDEYISFDIIDSIHDDTGNTEEFTKLVDYIDESVGLQISKHDGHIENTCDNLCVYTKDPDIICKVLKNNQRIINEMISCITDIKSHKPCGKCSCVFDISNELQTSITNVVNARESIEKKTKDNLAALNDLFN